MATNSDDVEVKIKPNFEDEEPSEEPGPQSPNHATDEQIRQIEDEIQRLTAQLIAMKEKKRKHMGITEEPAKRLKTEDTTPSYPYESQLPTGPPPVEAALYISDLPLTLTEEELKKAFSIFGRVYEAVIVKHKPTGESKGFGFVRYYSMEEVNRALSAAELPQFMDPMTQTMRVCRARLADPKNVLHISGIPRYTSDALIQYQLDQYTGLSSTKFDTKCPPGQNSGQAWVTYKDHPSALSALQRLQQNGCIIEGQLVTGVLQLWENRSDPSSRPAIPNELSDIKNLFVKNVTPNSTESVLRNVFGVGTNHGVDRIVIPLDTISKSHLGHAFIYFTDRRDAEIAKERCHGLELDGKRLEIEWSRPKTRPGPGMGRGRGAMPYAPAYPPTYGYPYQPAYPSHPAAGYPHHGAGRGAVVPPSEGYAQGYSAASYAGYYPQSGAAGSAAPYAYNYYHQ